MYRPILAALGTVVAGVAAAILPAQSQTSNVSIRVASYGGQFKALEQAYAGDRLTRQTGIKVDWVVGEPAAFVAQMIASRGRQPPFDVVILDSADQGSAIAAGVLAKLDPAQVPNLKHLYPKALNHDGYGPDLLYYSIGLVFNKPKLEAAGIPEPTSWEALSDPRLAGHVSIPEISNPTGSTFLIEMARLAHGDEKNLKPGLDKIAQIKASSYYTASATLEALIGSGSVWMSVFTNGRGWGMVDRGFPVGFVVPKEGTAGGADTINLVAGTAHPKEAQLFINMALDPTTQLGMAAEMSYGPSSTALRSVLTDYPKMAQKFPASATDIANLYKPDWAAYNANLKETNEYWNRHVKQ